MARHRKPREKKSNYITPEGYEGLRAELAHLWKVERPDVTARVAAAAAEGDRSENAEYIYGKKRLREIDGRIHYLSKRLDALTVVEPGARKVPGRIYFGAWVRLESLDGEQRVVRIVGPDEAALDEIAISMDSPMGRALLGKNVDDEVVVRAPKGEQEYDVVEVSYEPLE